MNDKTDYTRIERASKRRGAVTKTVTYVLLTLWGIIVL